MTKYRVEEHRDCKECPWHQKEDCNTVNHGASLDGSERPCLVVLEDDVNLDLLPGLEFVQKELQETVEEMDGNMEPGLNFDLIRRGAVNGVLLSVEAKIEKIKRSKS